MGNKRAERAIELMKRIIAIQQAAEELPGLQAELDTLIPADGNEVKSASGTKQRRARRRASVSAPVKAPTEKSQGSVGLDQRGGLTLALRNAVRTAGRDLTPQEIMAAAGIGEDRKNSGYSAISRLASKGEFVAGAKPGTYRPAS